MEGIIICETPMRVDRIAWLDEHTDCDTIISDSNDTENIYVLAYAERKDYNKDLYDLMKRFDNSRLLKGLSAQELYTIV